MKKIALRLVLGAALAAGLAACSDALVDPQPLSAPGRAARNASTASYTVTTEYRTYSCYYEQQGRIYEDRETWARDTYSYPGQTPVHGEPYFVSYDNIDHGPTAAIGSMPCDYYPGYW
jgi:hypothetical protein